MKKLKKQKSNKIHRCEFCDSKLEKSGHITWREIDGRKICEVFRCTGCDEMFWEISDVPDDEDGL